MKKPIVLALFAAFFAASSCAESEKTNDEPPLSEADVLTELAEQVEILYSDSARVRVKIRAPEMRNFARADQPKQEFLRGITVQFLDEKGQQTSILTAKSATREEQKKRILARDSVVLISSKQEKLTTEELLWNEETELLTTDKFVRISKPGEVIFGYGLEANQDFSHWKIRVPTGRLRVETPE